MKRIRPRFNEYWALDGSKTTPAEPYTCIIARQRTSSASAIGGSFLAVSYNETCAELRPFFCSRHTGNLTVIVFFFLCQLLLKQLYFLQS